MQCVIGENIKRAVDRAEANLNKSQEDCDLSRRKRDLAWMKTRLAEARKVHREWMDEWSEHRRHCRVCRGVP